MAEQPSDAGVEADASELPRPAPIPDRLSRPYWDAALEGRLVCPECRSCGHWFFRPELVCPSCNSLDWGWANAAGTGVIESMTTIHRAPHPSLPVPIVLASVRLDEGPYLLTNVVGDVDRAAIEGRVRAIFQEQRGDWILPQFEPVPEEDQ